MAEKKTAKQARAPKTTTGKATKKKTAAAKTSTKKTPTRKTSAKKTRTREASAKKRASKPKGGVSAMSVHLGHVFQLRPRVNTSYRPTDFTTARQLLRDETYASVQEAARAVVEKALELTHKGSPLQRSKRR